MTESKKFQLILIFIITLGFYFRTLDISNNIEKHHSFRQSHVASNIYFFAKDGISISTKMFAKNMSHKIFDFPLYQQLATLISWVIKTDIVLIGRAINIGVYFLSCYILYKLLLEFDLGNRLILITLFFYSISPLNIFYNRAVIPDNLAVLLSFFSLFFFIRWYKKPQDRYFYYFGMITTGILTVLIKNPIYLPIVIAMLFHLISCYEGDFDPKLYGRFLIFLLSILIAIIGFKLYTNYVNTASFQTPKWEWAWYFGTINQRLNLGNYLIFYNRFVQIATNKLFLALSIGGSILYFQRNTRFQRSVFLGLLIGMVITIFVFFKVHLVHDYYQIPFVFIICFFLAYAIDWLFSKLQGNVNKLLLSIILIALSFFYRVDIPRIEPIQLIGAGNFIQDNTPQGAFIFYVSGYKHTWDPTFLYFAKREGVNLAINQDTDDLEVNAQTNFEDVLQSVRFSSERIYIYSSIPLSSKNSQILEKKKKALEQYKPAMSIELIAQSINSLLYEIKVNK